MTATYDWRSTDHFVEDNKMKRTLSLAIAAVLAVGLASEAQAGWGRTLHYVPPRAPAVVTNHVVVPTTTYYAPTTTYYAPAATYVTPAPVVVARPATVVAPATVV